MPFENSLNSARTITYRTTALFPPIIAILLCFARPLLRLHFALYKRDVRRARFPDDDPGYVIAGLNPDRLLFIGDVAVAGYGVLRHGMTVASQTARFIAKDRRRGCVWGTIAATDLTVTRVARMPTLDAVDVDAAVIMLGIPDVLLATSSATWAGNLRVIVDHIRNQAGPNCRIVFAGIPAMGDFRPIPSLARMTMTLQIERLNRITCAVAAEMSKTSFVPFPEWRVGEMYVQEVFSWKSLHGMWARVLASATLQVMNDSDEPASDSKPA